MAASGVNVLRWSALFAGIAYGVSHQSTLSAQQKINEANRKYHEEERLIKEAKNEYIKKTMPSKDDGFVSNPDDPKFDLEAYLKRLEVDAK